MVNDRGDLGADAIPGSCLGLLLLFVGRTSGPSKRLDGLEVRRTKGVSEVSSDDEASVACRYQEEPCQLFLEYRMQDLDPIHQSVLREWSVYARHPIFKSVETWAP